MAAPTDVPKDLRKHLRKADKQGWRFEPTNSGYRLLAPDGKNIVTIHKTPSTRSIRNYLADMRRYGYKD